MDNIWIILLGLVGIGYSFYAKSKKAENEKNAKKNQEPTKSKTILDTILSELEQKENYNTSNEEYKFSRNLKNQVDVVENKEMDSLKSMNITEKALDMIEKGEQEKLVGDDKAFDLREAIIYSAILHRQYN